MKIDSVPNYITGPKNVKVQKYFAKPLRWGFCDWKLEIIALALTVPLALPMGELSAEQAD